MIGNQYGVFLLSTYNSVVTLQKLYATEKFYDVNLEEDKFDIVVMFAINQPHTDLEVSRNYVGEVERNLKTIRLLQPFDNDSRSYMPESL